MSLEDEICDALRLEQILRKSTYGHFDHDSNFDIGPDESCSDSGNVDISSKEQEVYLEPLIEETCSGTDYVTYRLSSENEDRE